MKYAGATMKNIPTGECWYILGVDSVSQTVCAEGWPASIAPIKDCIMVEEGTGITDEEAAYRLKTFGAQYQDDMVIIVCAHPAKHLIFISSGLRWCGWCGALYTRDWVAPKGTSLTSYEHDEHAECGECGTDEMVCRLCGHCPAHETCVDDDESIHIKDSWTATL